MPLKFIPISKEQAGLYRAGHLDANAQPPELLRSDGQGYPCRSCMCDIPTGAEMLLLSYRPFNSGQAYSEIGPIFLCKQECSPYSNEQTLPPILSSREQFMVRGYDNQERIVEGTGAYVVREDLGTALKRVLNSDQVTFAHIRSGTNTCFQCKVIEEA